MNQPVINWQCAAATHAGLARDNNEDRYHCDPARGIFLVIDGMGGQAAGEQAAEIARAQITARLLRQTGTTSERIREAIALANNEIYAQALVNPDWQGMACVLSVAVIEANCVTIGHVGDTRIYQLTAGQISKLTRDHSPVGIREELGKLTEIEAMRHPRRNEVFRDVGSRMRQPDDEDFIEIIETDLAADTALLLCSDGLSDLVTSAQIRQTVAMHADAPQLAVDALIAAANDAGGFDNITVVLVTNPNFARALQGSEQETAEQIVTTRQLRLGALVRSRPLVFAFGLLCGVLLFSLGQARWQRVNAAEVGRTLVVKANGSTGYATISAAMAVAQAGDTVLVEAVPNVVPFHWKAGIKVLPDQPLNACIILDAP